MIEGQTIGESPSLTVKKAGILDMGFPAAIAKVIEGKHITRREWNDPEIYGYRSNEKLTIHLRDGDHQWLVNDGDLLAEDWIVIEKTPISE